ncbi:hypothetical protein AOLI_G00167740 [Acnodon oligacanthus]
MSADHDVRLSVEETSPYPGSARLWGVNEDEQDPDGRICLHRVVSLARCVGTVVTRLWRSRTTACRVFRCCGWHEAVLSDIKLSVEETLPSQVSTQPWGLDEPSFCYNHHFIQTIPFYPWTDTQAD